MIVPEESLAWRLPGIGSAGAWIVLGGVDESERYRAWSRARSAVLDAREQGVIVELEQGSREWLAWRNTGIGASESAAILGVNPYQSHTEIWERKRGVCPLEEGGNEHTERGHRLEPEARTWYNRLTGRNMVPVCACHDRYPWLKASLDGWDGERVLEIKSRTDRNHRESLEGEIPPYYLVQIQHQLLVMGATRADYVSYCPSTKGARGTGFVVLPVQADPEYQAFLLDHLIKFWQSVLDGTPPPAPPL